MAILYLTEQQAWVNLEGDCLIVHIPEHTEGGKSNGKRERKMTVPLLKVEEVVILGNITISTPALACLLEAKVQISYLSKYGHYLGSLSPILTKNSILRLAQHEAYKDGTKRHAIAQRFVTGKLRNMRTILMRYQRQHTDPLFETQIESIKRSIAAAEKTTLHSPVNTSDELDHQSDMEPDEIATGRMNGLGPLLGCEGAGSAAYFGAFGQLIKSNWAHGFSKRVRRPPTDPVNAMLSYGYVILTSQIASTLAAVGFDPNLGSCPLLVIASAVNKSDHKRDELIVKWMSVGKGSIFLIALDNTPPLLKIPMRKLRRLFTCLELDSRKYISV